MVVGAGAAGLTAARLLRDAGITVTVLEARDRIGGHLHTTEIAEATVDLGGAWIHGSSGNPVASFCSAHGLQFHADPMRTDLYSDPVGGPASEAAIERLVEEVDRFHANLARIRRNVGPSTSFAQGIDW